MIKMKKVLMPTDFSQNANQALRYASVFADKFDSKLTLFHVIALFQDDPNNPRRHFPDLQALYTIMDQNAIADMDQFDLHFDKLRVNKVTVRGISPAEEIVNYADSNEAALIVMGTHGRSALGHFLIGSVAEKVVRHAKCPVLTISHPEKEMYELPAIKSILVPIDFSDHSKHALKYATSLAGVFAASLEFLHVIDQRVHPAYYVPRHRGAAEPQAARNHDGAPHDRRRAGRPGVVIGVGAGYVRTYVSVDYTTTTPPSWVLERPDPDGQPSGGNREVGVQLHLKVKFR